MVDRQSRASRYRRVYWPPVWNLETARGAAMQGFWAATFVAAVTAALSILSAFGVSLFGFDLSALADAAAFAILAVGIYRMWRVAAVAGFCLYILETAFRWATGGPKNPVLAVIITLAFVNSVRGTFAYRKWRTLGISAEGIGTESSGNG